MTLENDASNGTEENKSKEIPDGKGQNGTDHDSANQEKPAFDENEWFEQENQDGNDVHFGHLYIKKV